MRPVLLACLAAAVVATAARADAPAARSATGAQAGASAAEAPGTPAVPAPSPSEPTSRAAEEAARSEGSTWFALPVLFWLPETRLGFGATGGLHFQLAPDARPSSFFGAAVYTLQRQGSVDLAGELQLRGGSAITARVRATHFPDVFYGIGPRSQPGDREPFTRQTVDGYAIGELPLLGGRLRAGPRLEFRFEQIRDVEPGGQLASGTVEGTAGFHGVGAGANATYDTRDHAYWPLRGTYAQAYWVWFPGRHDQPAFDHGLLEGRRFLPLGDGRVLGLAAFAEWTGGQPPFTVLPSLGSTRFLRGFRGGRFRDRLAWSGQTELRLPVKGPLSVATFLAVGDVAPSVSGLRLDTIKIAGGAGLRWRLTREGANVRVDVAASKEGVDLYLLVLEAF